MNPRFYIKVTLFSLAVMTVIALVECGVEFLNG